MRVTKEIRGRGSAQKTFYRVAYWAAGKRHRKAFSSRLDAERWAKVNRHAPQRMGAALFEKWEAVPDCERQEILQARELLQKIGNGSSWLDFPIQQFHKA